jgi:CHAT domain-containing protein
MVGRGTFFVGFAAGLLATTLGAAAAPAAPNAAAVAVEKQAIETARLDSGADNFAAAEGEYRKLLALQTRMYGTDSAPVGDTLAELALQVSNQGRFDEAAALFRRAEPIVQVTASPAARARLASYQALDAANQRDYVDALKYARQSTAARRAEVADARKAMQAASGGQPVIPPNEGELAHSLRIEAEMALRLGDLASAEAASQEALWIVTQEPGLPLWWRADVVSLMGEVSAAGGRVVPAERDFRDARDLDKTIFGDTAPTALADIRLGEFYSAQQLYPASIEAYRAAFAILAKDPVARSEVVPDQIVPFEAAAAASNDPTLDADMFRASQLADSGIADQVIARVAARQAAGNAELAQLIREAQAAQTARDTARVDLAAEYAKPDEVRSRPREDQLNSEIERSSAQADALFVKVAQTFPDYAKLADPGPAALSAVQAQLQPNEALVTFVIGVKSSFALLVTPKGLTTMPLQVTQDSLAGDVAELRKAFVPEAGHLPVFSLKTAYSLYQGLLQPLSGKLAGVDHLIVVPGGVLSSLPLSLLVTQPPGDGQDYSNAAWLIRSMAVSQMPSPRAFLALRAERDRHATAPRAFLGVGDPNFSGANGVAGMKALSAAATQCREEGPMPADILRALPPLPDTAHEVQAVAAQMGAGSTVLLGAQASEPNVRAQALDQYRVVYFATHGLLPGELHCAGEPGLALTPPAVATSTNADGFLSASEIAALKLNADLVVLSACNTAQESNRFGGGSLQGLADAFFASGARAVLASHWEVPSQATTQLMIGVFNGAGHQQGLAQALRQSQLTLISQGATAHPFNWAAFTIIGEGSTLGRVAAINQFAQNEGGAKP